MYPYTLEQYNEAVKKEFKKDYSGRYDTEEELNEFLEDEETRKIIEEDYRAKKFLYEGNKKDVMNSIEKEVASTVSGLSMF